MNVKQKAEKFVEEHFKNVDQDVHESLVDGLRLLLKEQDRDTRHACAELIAWIPPANQEGIRFGFEECLVSKNQAHNEIMNCRGGVS